MVHHVDLVSVFMIHELVFFFFFFFFVNGTNGINPFLDRALLVSFVCLGSAEFFLLTVVLLHCRNSASSLFPCIRAGV